MGAVTTVVRTGFARGGIELRQSLTSPAWLGLGVRSVLLPASLAAVELGHSWRHLETLGVLGLWAVAGLVLAPILLRRMARRESGSAVAARREKAMSRAM
jgi:ABC-2 type transport system permease protein